MHPFLAWLIVAFVLFLILFPVLSAQLFIVWPWYGREWTVELLWVLLPFNMIAALLLWNYYLCMMTDPGRVPVAWKPDTTSGEGHEVKKQTGAPRYCRICEGYKPPRAHHCRQCGRCILRMDHHCPWVNNCIGYFNYGHFLRFLFYVDLCCTYHLAMVTRSFFSISKRPYYLMPSGMEVFITIANYSIVGPVLLVVGAFSLYHFHGLLSNTTTIEGWEDKTFTLKRHGKIREIKYPYNMGAWRNVTYMLGNNPLLWCCPATPPGTGLNYPVVVGDDIMDQHSWPPHDPATAAKEHDFTLPASPWTYQNGNVNPNLQPSNLCMRTSNGRHVSVEAYASALPPYHPDYEMECGSQPRQSYPLDSDSDPEDRRGIRIRRGSEGYEVRPVNREEMLRVHVENRVSREGRYQVYDHEPEYRSE